MVTGAGTLWGFEAGRFKKTIVNCSDPFLAALLEPPSRGNKGADRPSLRMPAMPLLFEICVDSVAGVRAAAAAGAQRVELCADLFEGGITPSAGMIAAARAAAPIAIHVIIRPRGGDFLFDDDEMAAMVHDIAVAGQAGADGVVIGLLTAEGAIDLARTKALAEAARPLAVTFHRAFDVCRDPFAALDQLAALGIDRILTTGQEATALEGAALIRALVERAGDRIIVMPGGVTPRTAARVVAETGARELHFAALAPVDSPMRHRNPRVFMGGELRQPEYQRLDTSAEMIRAVIAAAGE